MHDYTPCQFPQYSRNVHTETDMNLTKVWDFKKVWKNISANTQHTIKIKVWSKLKVWSEPKSVERAKTVEQTLKYFNQSVCKYLRHSLSTKLF